MEAGRFFIGMRRSARVDRYGAAFIGNGVTAPVKLGRICLISMLLLISACSTPVASPQLATATPSSIPTITQPRAQPTITYSSRTLVGQTGGVTQLAWSPDGAILASASDSPSDLDILIWDRNGSLLGTLSGHKAPILALAWSPDGKILASGSADQTVRLWARDGRLQRVLHIDRGRVFSVTWSPDASILATASIVQWLNPTVQLWKPDGTLVRTMGTNFSGGKFYNLLWSPDGSLLLGGATDYKLWRVDGAQVVALPGCEHCTPSWGAAWSPDSTMFAIGDENGTLQIYDRAGKPLKGFQSEDDVNAVAWSPDGTVLAGGRDLWSSGGQHVAGVSGRVNSIAWAPNGRIVALAADEFIDLLTPSGTHLAVLRGHTDRVNRVAWAPNALVLASASDDKTVRLWYLSDIP